jgi:hypothetical protein
VRLVCSTRLVAPWPGVAQAHHRPWDRRVDDADEGRLALLPEEVGDRLRDKYGRAVGMLDGQA